MKKEGEETGMCHGGEAEPPAGEEEPKTPAFPQLAYYAKATVSYSFGLDYPSAGHCFDEVFVVPFFAFLGPVPQHPAAWP